VTGRRDELAEEVIARLLLVNQAGSLAPVLEPEAFNLGEQLADALNSEVLGEGDDVGSGGVGADDRRAELRARHALGWLYWSQHNGLPDGPERDELRAGAIIALTPCFLDGVGALPEPLLPALAEHAAPQAIAIVRLADRQPVKGFDQAVLDRAVDVWTRIAAADAGQAAAAAYVSNLCGALQARARRTGSAADLDEAVAAGRQAVAAAPDGHPLYAGNQSNLAGALRARYEHQRDPEDLGEAVEAVRRAVAVTSERGPDRRRYLVNLAAILMLRFNRVGDSADLREAVSAARESAMSTPVTDPYRGGRLVTVAEALVRRYRLSGLSADLDEAISTVTAVLDAGLRPGWDRAFVVGMLGELLRLRAERPGWGGREADIDAAVSLARRAVALTSEASQTDEAVQGSRAIRLTNLAAALTTRARDFPSRPGARADLDEAITAGWAAVSIPASVPIAFPPVARAVTTAMANLAVALSTRADLGSVGGGAVDPNAVRADLDAAVAVGVAALTATDPALEATTADPMVRALAVTGLGNALGRRFQRLGDPTDRAGAIHCIEEAAGMTEAPARIRVRAAVIGGRLAASNDPAKGAALLETAIRLLPLLAPRHLTRGDAESTLGAITGVAGDAAAAALADESGGSLDTRATRALGLLELGRGILLSRGFDVRGDLAALERAAPALAARFIWLRAILDADSPPPSQSATAPGPADPGQLSEPTEEDRLLLAADLESVLVEIRSRDGFALFGLPPDSTALATAGAEGAVVVCNVTPENGHALIITGDRITALALPGLTAYTAQDQARIFYMALEEALADPQATPEGIPDVLAWLWDTVTGPVLEFLGIRAGPVGGAPPPRIWWAPGGLLGRLPVHAAGYHADPPAPAKRTVMDRVVFSYTPTVRTLLHARDRRDRVRAGAAVAGAAATGPAGLSSLIVAMPETPGVPGAVLPGALGEAVAVAKLVPDPLILAEPGPGAGPATPPTKPLVLAELARRQIAHFACHGVLDYADPAASRLLLHDHREDPMSVASLAAVDLSHVWLAFLSACDTALGLSGAELLDESTHLASAFQLAGFAHVVAAQWAVKDVVAARLAADFYARLADPGTGRLDPDRCARALRDAVAGQRDRYPDRPYLWAGYIHAGA
jgi:hypothetical protein